MFDRMSLEAALDLARFGESLARRLGGVGVTDRWKIEDVQHLFKVAQDEYGGGNQDAALKWAREGRLVVAAGLELAFGPGAIEAQVERTEAMVLVLCVDPGSFLDPSRLHTEVDALASAAREAWEAVDGRRAGQLTVLAEQRIRQRTREGGPEGALRPGLVVALGSSAVGLARTILEEVGTDRNHRQLLEGAEELRDRAEKALGSQCCRRAIHLADLAEWWALAGVALPGGVTREKAEFALQTARSLLAAARDAVDKEPSDLRRALLRKASLFIEGGAAQAVDRSLRCLGLRWKGSVICHLLVESPRAARAWPFERQRPSPWMEQGVLAPP
jgi:hypothetical protein